MTFDEFDQLFRGRMLLALSDAFASRHEPPSALGLLIDKYALDQKRLRLEMYNALIPPPPAAFPAGNGKPVAQTQGRKT